MKPIIGFKHSPRFPLFALYEPLVDTAIKWLSFKMAFLFAITIAWHISELHALLVSASVVCWGPLSSSISLWPSPMFLPKVLSPQFINQPSVLAAIPTDQRDMSLNRCPAMSLWSYIDRMVALCTSDQLFVGACKGAPHLSNTYCIGWWKQLPTPTSPCLLAYGSPSWSMMTFHLPPL